MSHIINIFKGITINSVLHFLLIAFLISSDFYISVTGFSITLAVIIIISGLITGMKRINFTGIHGLISGVATCYLFLLYISQYEPWDTTTNLYILVAYGLVGYLSSFVGNFLIKSA